MLFYRQGMDFLCFGGMGHGVSRGMSQGLQGAICSAPGIFPA